MQHQLQQELQLKIRDSAKDCSSSWSGCLDLCYTTLGLRPIVQDAHGNRVMVYLGLRPCRCSHADAVQGGSGGAICGSTVVAIKAPAVSTDSKHQKHGAKAMLLAGHQAGAMGGSPGSGLLCGAAASHSDGSLSTDRHRAMHSSITSESSRVKQTVPCLGMLKPLPALLSEV